MSEVFKKIDLPSGAWVALRDPELTTEGQRRPVKRLSVRAMASDAWAAMRGEKLMSDVSDADLDVIWNFAEALAVCLISEWSFEQPISIDGLQAIAGKADYEKLIEEVQEYRDALMPDFGVDPDPSSPTDASDGSAPVVEAANLNAESNSPTSSVSADPMSPMSTTGPSVS